MRQMGFRHTKSLPSRGQKKKAGYHKPHSHQHCAYCHPDLKCGKRRERFLVRLGR